MIRIRNLAAAVLSSMVLLGAGALASAQTATPNPPTNTNPQVNKGQTSVQLDREKVTLKDRVQGAISSADRQIDALKNMVKTDTGALKTRDETEQKQLSMLSDHLKKDVGDIDKATQAEWSSVRSMADHDLALMDARLQKVAAITKVAVPPTGVTNKQPGQTNKQPSGK